MDIDIDMVDKVDFVENIVTKVSRRRHLRPNYFESLTDEEYFQSEKDSTIWLSKKEAKKTKSEEAKSLGGSLSKYLSNSEEKKSGVAEEINQTVKSGSNIQIIDIEAANIGEKSTKCDINKNFDVIDTEIQDYKTNKLKKNTEEAKEYVASKLEFLSSNDAAHWPIPVPEYRKRQ
ncbi:hypothetical protein FQA39_LY07413 [Lamprigera yunnana]|nr:hypothetical protein FQA39_LY07413 [Lamprigera yunnana]